MRNSTASVRATLPVGALETMERTPVKSSLLVSVGYDRGELKLETELTSGAIYEYSAVPPWIHSGLMSADSLGDYYNKRIRDKYRWEQLRDPVR